MPVYYDISVSLSADLPVWPGDPRVSLDQVNKMEEGAEANVTHLHMSAHTGTHLDAPLHFIQGGKSIDEIPLGILVGESQVIEIPDGVPVIDQGVLEKSGLTPGIRRVLFKTSNSQYWGAKKPFQENYTALSADGAKYLVDQDIILVGMDYLSVAPFIDTKSTHQLLLSAEVVLLEGIDLSGVIPGFYQLICLPIKLKGADGAPARAILVSSEK